MILSCRVYERCTACTVLSLHDVFQTEEISSNRGEEQAQRGMREVGVLRTCRDIRWRNEEHRARECRVGRILSCAGAATLKTQRHDGHYEYSDKSMFTNIAATAQ